MTDAILCPGCKRYVEAEFYALHISGDQSNDKKPHDLKVINIPGMGGPELVQQPNPNPTPRSSWGSVILDLPYGGRIRRDFFLIWSLIMFILGIMMAGYYWRII